MRTRSSALRSGAAVRAGLLALVVAAGCREAPPPARQEGVDVLHYRVDLAVDEAALTVDGRAVLTVVVADSVTTLRLGLRGPEATAVEVDGVPVPVRQDRRGLVVDVPPGDTAEVTVGYRGRPESGLYREAVGAAVVVFTDGWPDRTAGWLPGHHHPSDPATLDLAVRLARSVRRVVVTGVPAPVPDAAVVRARLEAPVPTYAFAFAAAPFETDEVRRGDSLVVRHHRLGGGPRAALARTPEMLTFFSDLLGPYPHTAYASAEVPIPWAGMENATLAFLQPSLFPGAAAEAVQVHEVAHQWFGNRVVIAGWRDLWLAEGLASYLTVLFYEHADGRDAARRRLLETSALSAARRRTWGVLAPPAPVDPEAHLGWIPYAKGAGVAHLLRLRLGDAAFRSALAGVADRYAGRPLSTEAFVAAMQEHTRHDLGAFARFWIYGDGLPRLETSWDPAARRLAWTVREDDGTLAGLPFELAVAQDGAVRFVDARDGAVILSSSATPTVQPVGVFLAVD